MEGEIIGIKRAPKHPTYQQPIVSVQPLGLTQQYSGIEISLICIEYYLDAFTILYRLKAEQESLRQLVQTTDALIPFVHASMQDNGGEAYTIEAEPFIGSDEEGRGILRITPIISQAIREAYLKINTVTFYASNGQELQTLYLNEKEFAYTLVFEADRFAWQHK